MRSSESQIDVSHTSALNFISFKWAKLLKVIFVGMALSGKTSIIKRLIEGQDAKIPQSDERTVGVDIYEWDPKQAGGAASDSLMTRIPVDSELESRIKGSTGVKFSVWDFAGQHVYHATHELFFSTNSLYVLVWDMGANNPETIKKQKTFTEGEQGTFKLTYDSSDEEDDDFFDTEHENRRATRALEQDIDEKLQFWIDCIQSSAPGAAILPVASFDDYFTEGVGVEEARFRCRLMRERLLKHEQHRVKNMEQRLKEYDAKFGASSELAVRLRKLLCSFNRPKIIFGTDGPDVVRVSSTNFTGFDDLAERIVGISTGRERAGKPGSAPYATSRNRICPTYRLILATGWNYPIFRGHLGARIPRMRLAVRDCVRSMRDRFKVVEWGFFLDELKKKDIDNAADVADALHFLANIGELSYFGDVSPPKHQESRSPASNVGLVEGFDEDESQTPLNSSESVSLSTHTTRTLTGASFARNDRDENTRDSAPTQKRASHGLSEFVFLNPRWLVAAVACILRHDLTTEIYEVRRALRNAGDLGGGERCVWLLSYGLLITNASSVAKDACMLWQAKRFTKKAAERALQHSNNSNVSPYEFLQRLLVRFGVFVPVDLSIKTCLGGKDYSHHYEYADCLEFGPSYSSGLEQAPKFFFLPSLLGPGDANISEIWTYKTAESWKTTICHSILFPDGVPPGLMERITATILSDLYTNPANDNPGPLDPQEQRQDGRLRIKEILCWRSAFYLKLGNLEPDGGVSESIVEIFVTLVDQGSPQCVASDSTGVGMRRLVFSGKGQAGDNGAKIWRGGYLRILRIAVKHIEAEYSGLEIEKQAICPTCLAKKPIGQASLWDHSTIRSVRARGEQTIRCRSGHVNDVRLITGTYDQPDVDVLTTTAPLSDAGDIPVSNLLKAVVIVGVWDEKAQRIIRAGSGFIVDRKRGFVVTAAHTLMDRENWSEVKGKIVIGVIPKDRSSNDPVAVYRYFARILAKDPSINDAGVCTLDACILQIQTKMECDVHESDKTIGDQPETLLMNNPVAMKNENFDQLKLSEKHELDEAVRILGFNQGGEGLIGPGQEMNRCADFARGYVVMKFNVQENSVISNFQPRSEIVVICPTIGGHSGGPCVNQQGEVIGILSRADPADRQRCYLVPASEFAPLVKVAKKMLKLSSSRS
ncbi:hypothetical protein THAOC_31278 [Thalassiosira oceanica]|uniref:Serine protease n=1 Tax=Thalassiosira oceanica TaxID=159749 RepID=K0R9M0_THAOC|nr:hypothetical protein THAOC_31278 [Thalassiosira oceanica]|eukprot:EJK49810.1 hypothetical protein THAOC_31278 [Thalassiosira oceanica]